MSTSQRLLFRVAGLFAWLMVGVPVLIHPIERIDTFLTWIAVYCLSGLLFDRTLSNWDRLSPRSRRFSAASQAASVMAMVLLLCDGFEGTLLVLIALQLAHTVERRAGLTWIAVQTILLTLAIWAHWSLAPALMLAAPYFGFQVLAFLVVHAMKREVQLRDEGGRLEERVRISHEMHDAMGHHLAALSLNLEVAAHHARGEALEHVKKSQSLAKLLLHDVRDVLDKSHSARPNDLRETLADAADGIPHPRIHFDIPDNVRLEGESLSVITRCVREIVTNAVRHASADNLWIGFTSDGGLLEVVAQDDGQGAAAIIPGMGLNGMRERFERLGGALAFESRPGAGFRIVGRIPFERIPA